MPSFRDLKDWGWVKPVVEDPVDAARKADVRRLKQATADRVRAEEVPVSELDLSDDEELERWLA
tara:strand:- start:6131 stop:6322 length:192 start_codon:yes stop_codon:yes gene_type:complete